MTELFLLEMLFGGRMLWKSIDIWCSSEIKTELCGKIKQLPSGVASGKRKVTGLSLRRVPNHIYILQAGWCSGRNLLKKRRMQWPLNMMMELKSFIRYGYRTFRIISGSFWQMEASPSTRNPAL